MPISRDPSAEFNRDVWRIVRQVPMGIVTTYGQIASMIPCPAGTDPDEYKRFAPRWVGKAMNRVSSVDDKTTPWWRVINSKGGISMSMDSLGYTQKQRLMREGVAFNTKDLVDFKVVGWRGPDAEFLEDNGFLAPIPLYEEPSEDNPQQLSLF